MTINRSDSLVRFLENTLGPPRPPVPALPWQPQVQARDFYYKIEKHCRERRLIEARVRSLAKQIAGSRVWRKKTYFAHCIETELKPLLPEARKIVNALANKMAVRY